MTWNGGSIARVTAKMTDATGEAVQNVFHVRNTGSDTATGGAATAIGQWLESIYSEIEGVLNEDVTFQSFNVLLLETGEALGEFAWPTLTSGGAIGAQLPATDCVLSLMRTGFSKRVGRKYWGPFSVQAQSDGLFDATTVAACQAATLAASTSFVATNGVNLLGVIFNFALGAGVPIVQVATSGLARSQRRRARGIGI